MEERQAAGIAKAPFIVEYIVNLLEDYENEKFVIFCHHRSVHKILYDGLWKFSPMQIIGGQSDNARQGAIDKFHRPGLPCHNMRTARRKRRNQSDKGIICYICRA